ncbi:MAG TPA: DUF2799 domain-containing protein [Geminicoccaceae bacterium]|nr:DUF2799 domain-containing protein [Geminicoccaceae bacterium]
MDADECRTADWRAIGYEDGVQGRDAASFGTYRKACAEHGVSANLDAWLGGRGEGLEHFCRPQNGYRLGVQGNPYAGVCPLALEAGFVAAHAEGYGLYQREAALRQLEKQLHYSRRRAEEIEYLLADRTALLIAPDLETTARASIAIELKQLAQEKIRLEQSIDQLEHDSAAAEQEYEAYRQHSAGPRGD